MSPGPLVPGPIREDMSMAKKSRRNKEAAAADSAGLSRSERRRREHAADQRSGSGHRFLDQYRNVLVGGVAVLAVVLFGYIILSNATASAYSCDSLLEAPEQQASGPLVGETEDRLGFLVDDGGRSHSNATSDYVSCPPTSGDHRAGGALRREFYDPGSIQVPNDWVHNLEHGYAVIAYVGEPEREVLDQIRGVMDAAVPSEVAVSCGLPNKVIALRFDDMSTPFAVLAWDRALLLDTFDPELIAVAVEQFQDQPQAPEQAC